ncbi:MAG: TrkH family potassium uptake protein [Prevotella sp.]|jgi:trk system potassium uptake protein TrkH|nr:TrkH family potassium uptake protein [Prevotella sp.]MCI1281321.1 TrkH family potassium uptake protein [Prevotella sp.]
MINWKIIYKILGSLLFVEASLLFCCLIMAFCYKEDDTFAFLVALVTTMFFGFVLKGMGRNADNNLSRRDAYLVVSLAWIIFSLFGTMPFLVSGYLTSFADAYFETMSGFTTTGATIIDNVEIFPHGLLFWRSLTHWIGGLGIVFFTIALLPSMVGGSVKVFAAEATGPIRSKLHPRLSISAKWIWMVYLVLTVGCTLSYFAFGMNWFDSINYAMATTATGGFATHNTSMEYFHSPALEYAGAFFCLASGTNFTLLYIAFAKLKIKELFKNAEFKFYIYIVILFTLFIAVELVIYNHYDIEHAFRSGIFQVASFITTTGFYNDDPGLWPHATWVVLAACMFFGGCSGSTGGGFKAIRGVMVLRIIKNEFRQILHPNAVLPLKIDGVNIAQQKRVTLLAFFSTYLILCLVMSFILIAYGINNTDAITITLSSIGNVGPALGSQIGPTMSWSSLPDFAKWMCSLMMLIGRLEIFTVLVIFTPAFWKEN